MITNVGEWKHRFIFFWKMGGSGPRNLVLDLLNNAVV
jgi:hypothetical protein